MMYTLNYIYDKIHSYDYGYDFTRPIFSSKVLTRTIYLGDVSTKDWAEVKNMLKKHKIAYAYGDAPIVKSNKDYTLLIFYRSYDNGKKDEIKYGLARGKIASNKYFHFYPKDFINWRKGIESEMLRSIDILDKTKKDKRAQEHHSIVVSNCLKALDALKDEAEEYFEEHPSKINTFAKHCFGY